MQTCRRKTTKTMAYKIISGRFETGTKEQQFGYIQLFGNDDIQYFFDLYFHWYNLVHETGHCICERYGASLPAFDEEMFVNRFAVAYYRYVGEDDKLTILQDRLNAILSRIPSPVPEGETFAEFYKRIWNTEQIANVMIYGYFQLNSVLEALKQDSSLKDVLQEIKVSVNNPVTPGKCQAEVTSSNADLFLEKAVSNLKAIGVDVPDIKLELVDNPEIQCARPE